MDFVDPLPLHCLIILFGDFILDVEASLPSLAKSGLSAIPVLFGVRMGFSILINASWRVFVWLLLDFILRLKSK